MSLEGQIRACNRLTPKESYEALAPQGISLHNFSRLWHRVKSDGTVTTESEPEPINDPVAGPEPVIESDDDTEDATEVE